MGQVSRSGGSSKNGGKSVCDCLADVDVLSWRPIHAGMDPFVAFGFFTAGFFFFIASFVRFFTYVDSTPLSLLSLVKV